MQTVSTLLQTPEATRQSHSRTFLGGGIVTLEWISDGTSKANVDESAAILADLARNHKSDIPASIADFRKVVR